MATEKKWWKEFPDTFVIVFVLMVIMTILTYIIPAGTYDMVKDASGTMVVDPASFHYLPNTPVSIWGFLESVYKGCMNGAGIIFMVFLLGAYSKIIDDTGAISRAITVVVERYDKKSLLALPVLMAVMSFLGAANVVVDAVIAFIPLGLVIARKMRLDPVCAMAIMYLGAYEGFCSSFMAPMTVQTAQAIAGLPLLSGIGFRFCVTVVITIITIIYVMRYCFRVCGHLEKTVLDEDTIKKFVNAENTANEKAFSTRDILIILVFVGSVMFYVFCAIKYQMGFDGMIAMFFFAALVSAILAKMTPNQIARSFVQGIRDVAYGTILIGVSGTLAVIMREGQIIHTIIYGLSKVMGLFPGALSAISMFFVNLGFNFFVTSGPAQAAIVMPIMAPLADVLGITRQVAVLAFQYGDGFSNTIVPTSGVLMGCLGIAGIPFVKWLKFMMPLFLMWVLVGVIAISIAVQIGFH